MKFGMKNICSIILINSPIKIIDADRMDIFNIEDLLLVDFTYRRYLLPYIGSVSEILISEILLTKYMEKFGELTRNSKLMTSDYIRISSQCYDFLYSTFTYINSTKSHSSMFRDMMIYACISLFASQQGFMPFTLKLTNSISQKVKTIVCSDLSMAWRIKDVCSLIHVSESLLKKRLKSEDS